MLRRIFLGPLRFWALWVMVLAALYAAGKNQIHVSSFSWFLALLGALAVITVCGVVFTTRKEEQVTRDPLEVEEPAYDTTKEG